MLPEETKQKAVRKLGDFCRERVSPQAQDRLRLGYRFRGQTVTLYEERPVFSDQDRWIDISVAQFRYDPNSRKWSLHWADRNSRWHIYPDARPTANLDHLLDEIAADPTGIFWG